MKKILLMTLMTFAVACNNSGSKDNPTKEADEAVETANRARKKIESEAEEAKKVLNEAIRNAETNRQDIEEALKKGGQPGIVYITSVLGQEKEKEKSEKSDKESKTLVLHKQLQTSHIGGKSLNSDEPVKLEAKNPVQLFQPTKDTMMALEKASQADTYFNVGCAQINPKLTEGLNPIKMKVSGQVLTASAKRVIVCGKGLIKQKMATVYADELILQDADLLLKANVGFLSLNANKLMLIGDSKIETRGVDLPMQLFSGPAVFLNIQKSVQGEGSLEVKTVGGNTVASDDKDKKSQETKPSKK